jgi:hypothetical protein
MPDIENRHRNHDGETRPIVLGFLSWDRWFESQPVRQKPSIINWFYSCIRLGHVSSPIMSPSTLDEASGERLANGRENGVKLSGVTVNDRSEAIRRLVELGLKAKAK